MYENMRKYIFNKKSLLIILSISLFFTLIYFFFYKPTKAQVCLPLGGYLVWPGTWEAGRIPMASASQYVLTGSPIYVSGSNVGIGTTIPSQKLDVYGGYIRSDTGFCIGTNCINSWPAGGGGVETINAANVSAGQFGANTGGGNYYFMGNVGIGTTTPAQKLTVTGNIDVTGNRIVNLASPIDSTDAATKGYVDAQAGGGFPSGILQPFADPSPRPGWTYTGFWEDKGNLWTTKAPMPTARYGLAAAAVNNIIYAIGGSNGSGSYLSTNEAYASTFNLYWFQKQ
jgi:hypothetical protein